MWSYTFYGGHSRESNFSNVFAIHLGIMIAGNIFERLSIPMIIQGQSSIYSRHAKRCTRFIESPNEKHISTSVGGVGEEPVHDDR